MTAKHLRDVEVIIRAVAEQMATETGGAVALLLGGLSARTADGKLDNNALRNAVLKALHALSPEAFEELDQNVAGV